MSAVRLSTHKTGSRDNSKSTENILMKLDSLEIMHALFFSFNVEQLGCYGNK
jgi:hypothetical protein